MALRRTSDPAVEPLTLDEAKLHCRIDDGMGVVEDAWLTATIIAAREQAETRMQRSIIDSEFVLTLDEFSEAIHLPMPRVSLVTSVQYVDTNGTPQTLDSALYSLDNSSDYTNWLLPAYDVVWPATRDQANAVTITYRSGWADAAAVPQSVKLWMKLAIAAWYDVRAGMDLAPLPLQPYELPTTFFSDLLAKWTVQLV